MKTNILYLAFLLMSLMSCQSAQQESGSFHWVEKDQNLTLMNGEGIVWNFVYNANEKKTFFHPLYSLNGILMTNDKSLDHPWHHGLWFSWKKINDKNYWEEDSRLEGMSELKDIKITKNKDFSAVLKLLISYHLPNEAEIVSETRTILISAPDLQNQSYVIDWSSTFKATQDTSFSGSYAGINVRLSKNDKMHYRSSNDYSSDGSHSKIHGKEADWLEASIIQADKKASLRFYQSDENIRYPAPWFFRHNYPYMSPALLMKRTRDDSGKKQSVAPLTLSKGKSFTLKYQIKISGSSAP